MNKILLVFTLFCSVLFFGQNKTAVADTTQIKKDYFVILLNDSPVLANNINFKYNKTQKTNISIYNTFAQHNNVYFLQNGYYYQSNSVVLFDNNWMCSKIDSFNPYGAPNLGSAIVLGFITVLSNGLHR